MNEEIARSHYLQLPEDAQALLRQANSPPRLVAHLVLVHDVATGLVGELGRTFPELNFDKESVLFGAATHDIGKATHRNELKGPGKLHEEFGRELLIRLGVPESRARFALTHGNCLTAPDIRIEDMLVALADHTWKGKRCGELESVLAGAIAHQTGTPEWECFASLDEIAQRLSNGADERLAWMSQFPVDSR
jgi:hypothetical protein